MVNFQHQDWCSKDENKLRQITRGFNEQKVHSQIWDYVRKASNLIKELTIRSKVKTVVTGKVQEPKNRENNLPDLVNQMFKLLPHGKVTEYLTQT